MSDEERLVAPPWRSIRGSDVVVPAVLAAGGVAEIAGARSGATIVGVLTYLAATSALAGRRVAPLTAPVAIIALYAATPPLGYDVSQSSAWLLAIAYACFSAGCLPATSCWPRGAAVTVVTLGGALATLAWLTPFDPNVGFGLLATVGPWAVGVALRGAHERAAGLASAAERARIEGLVAVERAGERERERIAAELHDVLAHTLSAMVVQAAAAADHVLRAPDLAARELGRVADIGREAIAETRCLLRLLRDPQSELGLVGDPAAVRPPTQPVAPGRVDLRRPRPADIALPAVFGVLASIQIAVGDYRHPVLAASAAWFAAAALSARHGAPLLMPVVLVGILLAAGALGAETDRTSAWALAGVMACFTAGSRAAPPRLPLASLSVGVLFAWSLFYTASPDGVTTSDLLLAAALLFGAFVAGAALRASVERSREIAVMAERERLEIGDRIERAASSERMRIARELHDVLANSLSVMIVQASLGADLVSADPPAAEAAASEVEGAGRRALDEIGRLLRLIRAAGGTTSIAPQHGVAEIPALAEEYERAGLGVELEVAGAPGLPPGIDLSTYRIVQEALTNALKHAPGSPVRVRLDHSRDGVAIEVRNGPAAAGRAASLDGGHGLVGLRERVSLFGGEIAAGPTPDGGYLVAARLPFEAGGP